MPELQELVKRQLPASPVPQEGLVQHLMSSGVPGQASLMKEPPEAVHLAVGTQTPGAYEAPVQGPSNSERPIRTELAVVKEARRARVRMVIMRSGSMINKVYCM